MSIQDRKQNPYLILYREVKSDESLTTDVIDEEEDVESINGLLEDVRDNVEGYHLLDELDVTNYFRDWVSTLLAYSQDIDGSIENELWQIFDYIAEDFSGNMLSRARERGKYVVMIYSRGNLIVCHSFTGEMALTTEMDVIEELLSQSNIDKFAEFKYDNGGDIIVQHYDRHDTQSFTDWLGIPEDEIAFDVKGDVRIYTKIADIDTVFEFDEEDITGKLLGSDDYDLRDGSLITPNEPDRRIEKIRWGYDVYTDVEIFKKDLFKISHNLQRAFDLYADHISDSLDSFFEVEDCQQEIKKYKKDSVETIPKPNVDFELSFVNRYVNMEISWRKDLGNKIFAEMEPIPICHAGSDFSEEPLQIGNFRIYNDTELTDVQNAYTADLLRTAEDLGTGNLRPLFLYITFNLLSETTPKPLRSLFEEFSNEFGTRVTESISNGTRTIQTEGEDIDLEWKAPDWFERKTDIDDLAQGIHREFQSSRLLVLGINEDAKDIDVIESGVKSEKLNDIEMRLENEYGVSESHVWSVPLGNGHVVIALNVETPSDSFEGDITLLE